MANLYVERTEVDHADLIAQLDAEYDGWALSTHVPGLSVVVPLLPAGARVCAWVKPWVNMRPGARLQYGWEPVIVKPVRAPSRSVPDWISCNPTRLRGMPGAKPDGLCFWMFQAAGLRPDDELVDLFPGSGAVSRAWEKWRGQLPLSLGESKTEGRKRNAKLGLAIA